MCLKQYRYKNGKNKNKIKRLTTEEIQYLLFIIVIH